MAGFNQMISVIQTDLGYKLDKEQFENALDYKLDKEEYYQKKNENSLNEDSIKKLEHLFKQNKKKMDKMEDELKKKVKKVKKKHEKNVIKIDGVAFDLADLKTKFEEGGHGNNQNVKIL